MTRKTRKSTAKETASGIVSNSGNCPKGQDSVATASGIKCVPETEASATTTYDAPKRVTPTTNNILTEQDDIDITADTVDMDDEEEEAPGFSLGDAKILKEKLDVLFPASEQD